MNTHEMRDLLEENSMLGISFENTYVNACLAFKSREPLKDVVELMQLAIQGSEFLPDTDLVNEVASILATGKIENCGYHSVVYFPSLPYSNADYNQHEIDRRDDDGNLK